MQQYQEYYKYWYVIISMFIALSFVWSYNYYTNYNTIVDHRMIEAILRDAPVLIAAFVC